MAIPSLKIIGESINDSVPSTKRLFDAGDIEGLRELARFQDERGAAYIDVNVGGRTAEFMAEIVRKVQRVTAKPLSIDTPDPVLARAALEVYDPARAGGQKPILNSITALRAGMFDLYKVQPFRPILLISEQVVERSIAALPHARGNLRGGPVTWCGPSRRTAPAPATTTAFSIPASPRSAVIAKGT